MKFDPTIFSEYEQLLLKPTPHVFISRPSPIKGNFIEFYDRNIIRYNFDEEIPDDAFEEFLMDLSGEWDFFDNVRMSDGSVIMIVSDEMKEAIVQNFSDYVVHIKGFYQTEESLKTRKNILDQLDLTEDSDIILYTSMDRLNRGNSPTV